MVVSFGTTSVMFEVAWCVAHLLDGAVPRVPRRRSSSGWASSKWRARVVKITLGAHGARHDALDAAPVVARRAVPDGARPSSTRSGTRPSSRSSSSSRASCAGLSMVIVESALSHRAFRAPHRPDGARGPRRHHARPGARRGAVVLFAYFFLKLQGLADGGHWDLLATPYGALVPRRGARLRAAAVAAVRLRRARTAR